MLIPFAKYQALGNSFIVLDQIQRRGRLRRFGRLAKAICDRDAGVGADGFLIISGDAGSYRVDIYNADGTWAEKSGNGIRIAAMHLKNRGYPIGRKCRLGTGSGESEVVFYSGDKAKRMISATLGRPVFDTRRIPVATSKTRLINKRISRGGKAYRVSAVSVGNPHLILFCDGFDFDWQSIGKMFEKDRLFPKRINIGFVRVIDKSHIEVRDWERGVGPTRSSGTGAAAAMAVAATRRLTGREVEVKTTAGMLQVTWETGSDEISVRGPVLFVCEGSFFSGRD